MPGALFGWRPPSVSLPFSADAGVTSNILHHHAATTRHSAPLRQGHFLYLPLACFDRQNRAKIDQVAAIVDDDEMTLLNFFTRADPQHAIADVESHGLADLVERNKVNTCRKARVPRNGNLTSAEVLILASSKVFLSSKIGI